MINKGTFKKTKDAGINVQKIGYKKSVSNDVATDKPAK